MQPHNVNVFFVSKTWQTTKVLTQSRMQIRSLQTKAKLASLQMSKQAVHLVAPLTS